MKKLLSVVLALALCLTAMMGCFAVSAETVATSATINIAGGEAIKAGETATVTVTGSDFTDVCAADLVITLPAGFKLVSVSEAGEVLVNDENGVYYVYDETANTVRYIDVFNFNEEVKALDLALVVTAPADAEDGEYAVTGAVVAANIDEEFLGVTINNGAITVQNEVACEHVNAVKSVDENATDVTTEFVFDCSCPDCGETWEQRAPVAAEAYAGSIGLNRSIDPQNDISLLYYFRKEATDAAAVTNLVLYVEKEAYEKGATEATVAKLYYDTYESGTYPSISGERYFFKVSDVAPYEMGNDIDSKLYGMNADGEMVLLKTMTTYSVYAYAKGHFSDSEAIGNLLVDMLNYGAAAQVYGDFNANDLVNTYPEVVAAIESGLGTSDYPTTKAECFEWTDTSTKWPTEGWTTVEIGNSRSLIPAEKVKIVMQINRIKAGTSIEDYYCVYNYYDVRGNEAAPYTVQFSGDQYLGKNAFIFDQSPLSVLDYPVTATVYYGDPANGGIPVMNCQYSVETYIARNIESATPNLPELMKAMYAYGNSMAELTGVTPAEDFFS